MGNVQPVGQSNSPTDEMVNIAQAEKAMKKERRNQWLNMNQTSASNVLSSLGADLPAHLRNESSAAQEILSGALGVQKDARMKLFCVECGKSLYVVWLEKGVLLLRHLKQNLRMMF